MKAQIKTDSKKIELCNSILSKVGYCKAKEILKKQYNINIWLEV
jgi:hypothetical protein